MEKNLKKGKNVGKEVSLPTLLFMKEYYVLDSIIQDGNNFIMIGEIDPVKDEIELFSEKVNGKYYCFESNTHGFIRNIHTMKDDIYNIIKKILPIR